MDNKSKNENILFDILESDSQTNKNGQSSSKSMLGMVFNGQPAIIENPVRFREQIQDIFRIAMLSRPDLDTDKLYSEGTLYEIAIHRQLCNAAEGDLDALKFFTERVLGKPVTQSINKNMSMTYEQYLDALSDDDGNESHTE